MENSKLQQAINIIRQWLYNEQIIDRTIDDDIKLTHIKQKAAEFISSTAGEILDKEEILEHNLNSIHIKLMKEKGLYIDVYLLDGKWYYNIIVCYSGNYIAQNTIGFGTYRQALEKGIKEAVDYDERLIH